MSKNWRIAATFTGLSRLFLLVIVVLATLTGCAKSAREQVGVPAPPEVAYVEVAAEDTALYHAVSEDVLYRADEATSSVETGFQPQERLIIRNADLSIVVDDTVESMEAIEELVNGTEGWVVNSNVWEYDGIKRGNISVRVPAEGLDAFLDQVHSLANEVPRQSVSGQDVTEEYVDIQAQLSNLQATRDRVRSFLDDADDVEEALAVNVELGRLEGEIERITGRMKYLESSARYSSVNIEITPDELAQPMHIGRWQPEGTARDAIQALISTLQWLADALIVLALYVLPVALVIVGPIYLFIRYLRKRRAKRAVE